MNKGVRNGLLLASLGLVLGGVAQAQDTTPTNGNLPPGALASSWDPTYNVCRGVDIGCYHDWVGAANRQNRVLIFTRTAGPRHANLGTALAAGLNPPLNANNTLIAGLKGWLEAEGIAVDWTEDVNTLAGSLNKYKAVIFASNSRDALWKHGTAVNPARAVDTTTSAYLDAAKVSLRQYIRAGGGFVAIHNAFGTEYNWPWYEGLLGNANYYDHGNFQPGTAQVVAPDPATAGLPVRWDFQDEWYNLVPYPTKVKFLVTVDETTLATRRTTHPGHGAFHPVAWCQYYDGGRAFLTTLGHDTRAFTDGSGFPGQAQYKSLIVNGVKSAMGLTNFCVK
jgi:uncharacterized protein